MKKRNLIGFTAIAGSMVSSAAMAAVDVSAQVDTMIADGTSVITAIGIGMFTLAGVTVVFKWGKAQFF
ncbi:MAG: hypothetical protein HRU28_05950 [Rhizobiales bacterium]|nr:hypothetical protein [Hyphomicrobiales bacterium]